MAILVRLYWLIRHLLSESGAAARRRTPPRWRSWPLRGCFNDVGTHLAYRVEPQALQ